MFKWLVKKFAVTEEQQKPVPSDGAKAHELGFNLKDNPYRKHTPKHSIWRDDWLFAARRFR